MDKVNWKPRFALWGCNSGLFTPGSACIDNPQYISTCACRGEFCSPELSIKLMICRIKSSRCYCEIRYQTKNHFH